MFICRRSSIDATTVPRERRNYVGFTTLVTYGQYQKHLLAVFGEMPAESLTPKHAARYVDLCKRASRDNEMSVLRAAYNHALRTRDIPSNP